LEEIKNMKKIFVRQFSLVSNRLIHLSFVLVLLLINVFVNIKVNSQSQNGPSSSTSNPPSSQRILVFAPHPDDDIIGCGGSIAKHIQKGNQVAIVYLTSGNAGRLDYSKEDLANIRESEAKEAAELLGVNHLYFLKQDDGYLSASKENIVKVMEIIREFKPNVIYVTHAEEGHRDHRVANELVLLASGRAKGSWFQEAKGQPWSVSTILAYEVHPPMRNTGYCEDITEFMDLKMQALQKHISQVEQIEYDQAVKGLNSYRGILTDGKSKYAECFQIIESNSILNLESNH
jgi:LmbE family N-acetylglucosaminyl deacetylase